MTAIPTVATSAAEKAPQHIDYSGILLKERYRVVKELGRGGFATAYLAYDEELLSKAVVVKVLHTLIADQWLLRKFNQEKEALARIDHPGVVAVLDAGQTPQGTPFLVMQYVDGVTLRSLICPDGMPLSRAGEICRQIGSALQAAHDKGICHRDMKPENIMIQVCDSEDRVRLIDFGIAGIANSLYDSANQSTRIAGTFRYMPPEQLEGKVCSQSDIYSFGAVVYEVLTGRPPVESPLQLIAMGVDGLKVRPRNLRPEIPETAQSIILKALSFNVEQRYASAREMGELLADSLHAARTPKAAAEAGIRPENPDARRQPAGEHLEIAHVLFMDLVAYSTIPMEEQRERLQSLEDVVRHAPHFIQAERDKTVIALPTGDGMALVFFGDPTVAAQCALEIAEAIRKQPLLQLRIGLHSGPVYRVADINKNLNVSGGGINGAQRVMDAGDAGHILVSSGLADVLAQLGQWRGCLSDLGEHDVKHGVVVRFYNLCSQDAGNPAWPSKWSKPPQRAALDSRRRILTGGAVVLLGGAATALILRLKQNDKPPAAAQLALNYFITVQRYKNGKPLRDPSQLAGEMLFQEDFRIAVNVIPSQAGCLYVLNEGPLEDGAISINVMHPQPGAKAQLATGQPVRIPAKEWFVFDQGAGTEKLYLVWSAEPVAVFEAAKDQTDFVVKGVVVIKGAARLAPLRAALAKYLIPPTQIRKDETTRMTILSSTQEVLVHLIQLEHQ
ncbi:MAG TPA: protein kinase [Candidatus Acidoferrales bacterium]|jgi:serine/threonine protein kinase|nr:protein kinase [Candidatus Acidoferrales bacterium]